MIYQKKNVRLVKRQLNLYMISSCEILPRGAITYNPIKTQRLKVSDLARLVQVACQQ